MSKSRLGKGLSALIPDSGEESTRSTEVIPVNKIFKNPYQPRKKFDDEKLQEMVQSIKEHGVIQPVVVRKKEKGYELVAGERRFRASQLARLDKIPAIVKEFSDSEMLEISLIENLQRENLNPLEEAEAYKQLIDQFGFTQDNIASRLGKSRPVIANTLRLLSLGSEVKDFLMEGKISAGHARALVSVESQELQREIAQEIVQKNLTVRQIEEVIQQKRNKNSGNNAPGQAEKKKKVRTDPFLNDLEEKMCHYFGTRVKITEGKNKGKIEIEYYNPGELERIAEKILNI